MQGPSWGQVSLDCDLGQKGELLLICVFQLPYKLEPQDPSVQQGQAAPTWRAQGAVPAFGSPMQG